jgi:uncharacterized repeat protein (TIGR03806 family)
MSIIQRILITLLAALIICGCKTHAVSKTKPYGLIERPRAVAYLNMPQRANGKFPQLLSQTGVFADVRSLKLNKELIPYDLIVAFWSDGAVKSRAVAIPEGKVGFTASEAWHFPNGTIFVKTFALPIDATLPTLTRRLETRLLVRDADGGVYGAVYKWRPDNSDAELLDDQSLTEDINIKSLNGQTRVQKWYYPSRQDCQTCHSANAGLILGVKTRQMNRTLTYPSSATDNQLRAWNHVGLFDQKLDDTDLASFTALASADDQSRSVEDRARSYLDANCAHCHRPQGTVANFDARYDTPLQKQQLIDGPVLINEGIDRARVISPHDVWRSIALMRVSTNGDVRMPPIARMTIDQQGVAVLTQWIESLPGQAVLPPPIISPAGGSYKTPVEVVLKVGEPGADIRYTLDGSTPTASDQRYERPIKLTDPTVVRARAFKEGFTRSIPTQEVFVIEN